MIDYGFEAVPIDIQRILQGRKYIHPPTAQTVASIKIPDSAVAKAIGEYAKKELPMPTYNHSVRVFYYGMAIMKDQFPEWKLDAEVYYVTCMLHDIGTTDKNLHGTKMSFEFYGGYIARDLVYEFTDGNKDYAEAVCEAVIRHQDLRTIGNITILGLLLQLATILDNVGLYETLIHELTIQDVNENVKRHKWLGCFANTVDAEYEAKPWCHTTALGIEDFKNGILGNRIMAKFE